MGELKITVTTRAELEKLQQQGLVEPTAWEWIAIDLIEATERLRQIQARPWWKFWSKT